LIEAIIISGAGRVRKALSLRGLTIAPVMSANQSVAAAVLRPMGKVMDRADSPRVSALLAWPAWAWPLFGIGYGLSWLLLLELSHALWFLPAGLRLAALWLTPSRRWPWLIGSEWLALCWLNLNAGQSLFSWVFVGINLLPCLVYAACALAIRGPMPGTPPDSPRAMVALLGTGLVSALLVSPLLSIFIPAPTASGLSDALMYMYGDFIGQLVVAPLLVWLAFETARPARLRSMGMDLCLQLATVLVIFALLGHYPELAPYLLMLMFVPLFSASFRKGWEGAALSVCMVGIAIEVFHNMKRLPVDITLLQVVLAVVGGAALLLGAATTALRRSHAALAQRHQQLAVMNQDLAVVANELRQVSQRLVRLQEHGQRELATALEYELGQSISALGTRISLAFRETRDDHAMRLLESLREQVRESQDSLRRALRQLRPAILDSAGLREALDRGPLREMLDDAGAEFESHCYGRPEALDDDARTALYRICQSAVREAVKHQALRRVTIKLDAMPAEAGQLDVALQVDIELSLSPENSIGTEPVSDIRDRTLALRGDYVTETLASGLRHRIRFICHPQAITTSG